MASPECVHIPDVRGQGQPTLLHGLNELDYYRRKGGGSLKVNWTEVCPLETFPKAKSLHTLRGLFMFLLSKKKIKHLLCLRFIPCKTFCLLFPASCFFIF